MNIPSKILLVFSLTISSSALKSQDYDYDNLFHNHKSSPDEKKERNLKDYESFVLLNLGVAVPVGEYGSTNPLDDNPSFAKTGIDLHLSAGFPIFNFFYSSTSIGYIKNSAKMDELTSLYRQVFNFNGFNLLEFGYKGYNQFYLTSGFLVTGRLDIVSFDFRVQLGASVGIDTEQNFLYSDGTNGYNAISEKASDVSFMPSLGTSARIKMKENLLLSVNFDYRHAKYNFTDVQTTINGIPVGSDNYTVKMNIISAGVGIGLRF